MKFISAVLGWIVLLPLWRRLFKPTGAQVIFAIATGLVWIIVIAAVAGGSGGDKDTKEEVSGGQAPAAQATSKPRAPASTPLPDKSLSKVKAVAGAIAEAEDVRITLNEIVDPWASDNQFIQPEAGKRIVAFDVTIENIGKSGTHTTNPFNFKVTDVESFAYDPAFFGPEPSLDFIDLGSSEKTRGWVSFEVDSNTALAVLKYDPDIFTKSDIEFQFQ